MGLQCLTIEIGANCINILTFMAVQFRGNFYFFDSYI